MSSSKIIIGKGSKETHEYLLVSKDLGMFKANAETRICYSQTALFPELHYEEKWDAEIEYEINGKKVNWQGFKELYDKLYGKDAFTDFDNSLEDELQEEASKVHRNNYKCIRFLDKEEAAKYMDATVDSDETTRHTAVCEFSGKKYMYTSDYLAIELAKKQERYAIRRLCVPHTNNLGRKAYEHNVVVLHEYNEK